MNIFFYWKKTIAIRRRTRIKTLEIYLFNKNLSSQELDFEIAKEGLEIGGEDRCGNPQAVLIETE